MTLPKLPVLLALALAHALAVVLALGFAAALPAHAAPPPAVALILGVEGAVDPASEPFTEITAGVALTLSDDAMLEFSHYPTCREVLVRGGLVVFTEQTFLVRKGEVVRETQVGCPQSISLPWDGEVAGLTMRAVRATVVGPYPSFVLVGDAPARLGRWRILREDVPLGEGRVASSKIDWPQERDPLTVGTDYSLELVGTEGDGSRRIPFVVSGGGRQAMTIIRLD